MKVVDGVIVLNCNADKVEQVLHCDTQIPYTQDYHKIIVDKQYTEVTVRYTDYREDNNGFPFIHTDQEYYACLHWIIYKLLLRRFMMGTEKGDRLQYFERLKNKYVNQARVTITSQDMQNIINTVYTTYGRANTKYRQ